MSDIATRIKEARKVLNMSQGELAEKAGLTPSAISQFESGDRAPSYESLTKLSTALKVDLNFLSGKDESNESSDIQVLFRDLKSLTDKDRQFMLQVYQHLKDKKKKNG
jgi:transcriptional regulator with XRE-family HTH domain